MASNRNRKDGANEILPLGRPLPPQHNPQPTTPNRPSQTKQATKNAPPAKKPGAPQKSRHIDTCRFFKRTSSANPNSVKSFHFIEETERKGVTFFYKNNEPGSIMSELEACNWGYYHLLVPEIVPAKTNAHYNAAGEYIGLSSQKLEGFAPTMDDPLTDADLNNAELIRGLARGLIASYIFVEDDCHRFNIGKDGKRVDFDNSLYPIIGQLKKRSMLNPITMLDKSSRPFDEKFFPVTMQDIEHFPELKDANPYYWVTKPEPVIIEHTRTLIGWTGVPISKNSFTVTENPTYKKLQKNELFVYHKFATLLKFILTPDKNLRYIAEQHISAERNVVNDDYQKRAVSEMMSSYVLKRKKMFLDALVKMESFRDFIKKYGDKALAEIQTEFKEHNQLIDEHEYEKYKKSGKTRSAEFKIKAKVNPNLVQEAYDEVFAEMRKHLCTSNANRATQIRK